MKTIFQLKTGVIIAIFVMMWNFSYAGEPSCNANSTGIEFGKKSFTRTFKHATLTKSSVTKKANSLKSLNDWGPEVTYNDIIANYGSNKSVEFSWKTAEGTAFSMNIGTIDHENPQTWILPDFGLTTAPAGLNVDISTLDFLDEFPGTTHAKKFNYDDGDLYELYEVADEEVYIVGTYYTYDSGDTESYLIEGLYVPLPFGVGYDYYYEFEYDMVDSIYVTAQEITFDGYGTINTPDGSHVDVIKIHNHLNDTIYDLDYNIMETFEYDIITFYAKDGFRLNLYLQEGSPTTGDVQIKYIEQEKITTATSVENLPLSQSENLFYPNPANDIIRFHEQGNYQIFDVNGKLVRTLSNAAQVNVSDLQQGVYFVKSANNKIQKLMVK